MSATEPDIPILVTREELQILIGGVHEALFELGDEFHARVGKPAPQAQKLVARLVAVLNALGTGMSNDHVDCGREQKSDG